ncbi:hypothetical protein F2Q68_00024865 [Brassica cretica]|uniref:Flowering locus T n=1 Tax=Brassica cretica TaxID=69181 RepID=A0A8S9IE76_BRACR|nr:hypothetical protein F2Q68_00024865 [Brassica cretica]
MSLSPRDPLVLARVVGDVVDPFMRLISLSVNYGQRQVTNGLDLRTSQVLNKPTVEIGGDDLRNFYTLMCQVQATLTSENISIGNELVHYENPCPTSGIHRVALMLFWQLGRQTVYAPEWRQRFNTREFAENYNLGLPVAAVFFNCQRENGCGGRRT